MAKNKNLYRFTAWAGRLETALRTKIVDLYQHKGDAGWKVRMASGEHANVPVAVTVDRLCLALYSNAAVIAQARWNVRGVAGDLARQERQNANTQAELNRLIAEQRSDARSSRAGR